MLFLGLKVMYIEVQGECEVKVKDIKVDVDIEICNLDYYIVIFNFDVRFFMEIIVN